MNAPSRLPRPPATVRFRISALATIVVVAMLVVTGIGLVVAHRRLLTASLEDTLRQRADDVATAIEAGRIPDPLPGPGGDETLAQVVGADGRVLAATANLAGDQPIAPAAMASPAPVERFSTVYGLAFDDDPFRVISRTADSPAGRVVIHVGASLDDIEESTGFLVASLFVAVPAVALLMAVLVWWLVGRTLQPVAAIRNQVADIGAGGLDRRVPAPPGDDEIARLAHTMNAMLDRLEDAAHRQDRFVADASHELRGPLTRIRSQLEVDAAHPRSADPAATQRSVLEEIAALQRLVDDLLHLARSDAAAAPPARRTVDLDDVVFRDAGRLRAEGHVQVDVAGVSAAQTEGDAEQLARAVRNVADNAARHTRSTVAFSLAERDGHATLAIADDGPGIPADQQKRVFERFARVDDSRTAGRGGTGLGLAIAREIVERHGGTIAIDPDHHPGTRVVMTFPGPGGTR